MYIVILCRLRYAVRREHPEKLRTNGRFLLHYNAPPHRSVLVKHFLARNNVTTLKLPQYSSDLGPADFYLLLRLNNIEATDNIGRKD